MKVFVFGHYDSRGGTIAIRADDREKANQLYNKVFAGQLVGVEDFMGVAELSGVTNDHIGTDLCDSGAVFFKADGPRGEGDFDFDGRMPEAAELLYVDGAGMNEQAPEGYVWPRWDDDAFGFLLMDADSIDNVMGTNEWKG